MIPQPGPLDRVLRNWSNETLDREMAFAAGTASDPAMAIWLSALQAEALRRSGTDTQ